MINMEKVTLKHLRKNFFSLGDLGECGLPEELLKLKGIADFIMCNSMCDSGALSVEDNKYALRCMLNDIADNITKGLDHIDSEIFFKLNGAATSEQETPEGPTLHT